MKVQLQNCLTLALDGGESWLDAPAALLPGKYPPYTH